MDLPLIIGMSLLVSVVGGYLVASVLLLKFPQLLHRKKKLRFRPVHISHRGGAGENCENTMTAFRHALSHGTQMLEIDCHLTNDGEVVVSHDQHLLSKCGSDVKISNIDLIDLPEYKPILSLDFMPTFTLNCGEDRKIPTLREVFTAFPDTPLNIDVKVFDERLFNKVHSLIVEFHREDITVWGGRLSETTKALNKLDPDIPVFFSSRRVFILIFLYYSGLLPFVPLYESTLEIIMPSIVFSFRGFSRHPLGMSRFIGIIADFGVDFREANTGAPLSWKFRTLLHIVDVLLMRPSLFRHLDKRGIQTYLWVLNEEHDWDRAFQLGVTGVMTDFPSKLAAYLQKHPELHTLNDSNISTAEDHLILSKQPET